MKARDTNRPAPAVAAAPRPRRGRAPARLALVAAVLVVGAAAAWLAWLPHRVRMAAQADSLATMSPQDAYAHALELMRARRCAESLPYFLHAERDPGSAFAQLHYNHAGALYNTLFVADTVAGVTRPLWHTSETRVAVMRECLAHFLRAHELARDPEEKAFYANRLGRVLQVWGFTWEAFVWFREAAAQAPRNAQYLNQARTFQEVMSNPLLGTDGGAARDTL